VLFQELPGPNPDELRDAMIKGGISADVCINDLEPPAHMVLPKLKDIKKALGDSGFTTVLLSGSGATTFAHRFASCPVARRFSFMAVPASLRDGNILSHTGMPLPVNRRKHPP
jgi:hypothetical protein